MSARVHLLAITLFAAGLGTACGGDRSTHDLSSSSTSSGNVASTGSGGQSAGGAGGAGGTTSAGGNQGYTIDDVISWHQPALSTSIHFSPEDDLQALVLAQLSQAQTSIRLAFFNIRLEEVRDLLVQKKNAGVDVEVILDKKQQDLSFNTMAVELTQAGVPVTVVENSSAEFATMHDKFVIVDGHLLMTGSANLSYTALNVSDEDMLTIDDSALAARYQLEFDEIVAFGDAVSAPYPPTAAIQAWMGPEDGLLSRVNDALDAATTSALVAMFDLNQSNLVDALLDAKLRGVNVVVVLDQLQADDLDADADETLAAAGVAVILAENTGGMQAEMHSKFVVIDHQRVLMGSYNWTNLASFYNDENLVVIDDAHLAARVEGKLASLLDSYTTTSPSALGLVEGPQAVSFEVSNVTLDPDVELTIESDQNGPFPSPTALDNGSISANIPAGTRVSYRYAIRQNGTTLAEESATHSFTVPYAAGPFAVVDAFTP
jgi:phosphatidylserine/phosphatidylglycerophosphate/cardiolipin synthase-like enzyme